MSQVRSGSEPAAATLVGSLAAFPLLDVLDLLSRTGRTGELQVVGHDLDRRIWVDHGDVVDTTGTGSPGSGLFELACIEDGWFYFTLADATPDDTGRASLSSVIDGLTPQVTEWHSLVARFPFDATVRMSSSTPADEVQIRADQWQLLSLVGAGREVREVVAASLLHPLDTLRTLHELADGLLVSVEPAGGAAAPGHAAVDTTGDGAGSGAAPGYATGDGAGSGAAPGYAAAGGGAGYTTGDGVGDGAGYTAGPGTGDGWIGNGAVVEPEPEPEPDPVTATPAAEPEPVTTVPAASAVAPVTEPLSAVSAVSAATSGSEPVAEPVAAVTPTAAPVEPATTEGDVVADERPPPLTAPPPPAPAADGGPPTGRAQGPVMPPPISGDPWSTPLFSPTEPRPGDEPA